MTKLKADVIASAYSKLRISGLTVEPNPSDLELALGELESMMAELASRGIEVGYFFEELPDPNSELGAPQWSWNMIITNLACRLISDFNKEVPPMLMMQAGQAMANASARCAAERVRGVRYPARQPVGSGSRIFERWRRFYDGFDSPAPNDPSTRYIDQGEVNDFAESFEAYLRIDETLAQVEIVSDTGMLVVSQSVDTPIVRYRLQIPIDSAAQQWQQLRMTATTSLGRVDIRVLNFEVRPYVRVGANG